MFSHDSTDNLLDNLETELAEMIELERPKQKSSPKPPERKASPSSVKKRTPPPVPARRNVQASINDHPVPASRRLSSTLDKKEKNDENQSIQLQSMTSDDHDSITSDSQQGTSRQNTVIALNEKRTTTSNVHVMHETEKMSDNTNETFFVIKHGKWAIEQEDSPKSDEIKIVKDEGHEKEEERSRKSMLAEKSNKHDRKKKTKLAKTKRESHSTTTSATQSADSSSTESSSLDESSLPMKKTKKTRRGTKKEKKKGTLESSCTDESGSKKDESGSKIDEMLTMTSDHEKAIAIFVNNTGSIQYRKSLRNAQIKVSLYNEDNGKQVGETQWTNGGKLANDHFFNLISIWNETITLGHDIKHLRKVHSRILVFFEMIGGESVSAPVCWAFFRLFSPNSLNIDRKFKLQLYEYQRVSNSCFGSIFSKKPPVEIPIFEQWQMNRKKFPSTLNVFVKDLSFAATENNEEVAAESERMSEKIRASNESILRHWRKIPGQACKVPNKTTARKMLHDKGSLLVRFSHDGNFLAYSEVSQHGHLLNITSFPDMSIAFTMLEHSDLIHDIDWLKQKSYEHQRLVTSSADFTAIVWKIEDDSYSYTILQHPSFVYAAKFLQNDSSSVVQVVTGGRDNAVRIWRSRSGMQSFENIQELKHPKTNSVTFITAIVATRSADAFYTSTSSGDIVEWVANNAGAYQLNRHFKFTEVRQRIINCMQLNPRGNKICFRVHDVNDNDSTSSIFVLGLPTGTVTQRYQQSNAQRENQGQLLISPCGSQLFATNGQVIRHYQLVNGNVVPPTDSERNILKVKLCLGDKGGGFVAAMDYHPKDFYLAIATYGANRSSIFICAYESSEKDPLEQMKMVSSQETILQKSRSEQIGAFSDILRRMDNVLLAPPSQDVGDCQSILRTAETERRNSHFEDNTFTIESNRSKTYTASKGPATFTIQNGTYEIQKNDETDEDETTVSESFN